MLARTAVGFGLKLLIIYKKGTYISCKTEYKVELITGGRSSRLTINIK